MDIMEAMWQRHAVRSYLDKSLEGETLRALEGCIAECNRESGLHIQLVKNEPRAFDSTMAHYGNFSGVTNYIALIGKKSPQLDELCGYFGEKIVLQAQMLGLNTCWVALTFKKIPDAYRVDAGEKLAIVIALGYGAAQGVPHKSKPMDVLCEVNGETPEWFRKGMEAAMLAPTAMNQQKFKLTRNGNKVTAKAAFGPYTKLDLGIIKYHFEIGAGKDNFIWA